MRIRYTPSPSTTVTARLLGRAVAIDAPAAEQNLSRRLRTAPRSSERSDRLTLDDPKLWDHAWLYIVEPGNMRLRTTTSGICASSCCAAERSPSTTFTVPTRGTTSPRRCAACSLPRVVDLEPPHPIYSSFYAINAYPQTPGLGSFFAGRTWEKGGFVARLRAILDDRGRPMVLANCNTDMGDGVEWSNAEEYPGYLKYTADSYRMFINEIIYSLTH